MEAATVLHRIGACAALLLLGVPTAQRADAQAWDAVKYFQYNIENVTVAPDVVAPGSYKVRVMFSVTDPANGGAAWNIKTAPPFQFTGVDPVSGAAISARLTLDIGWDPASDFTNTGSANAALTALPSTATGTASAMVAQVANLHTSGSQPCTADACPGVASVTNRYWAEKTVTPVPFGSAAVAYGRVAIEGRPVCNGLVECAATPNAIVPVTSATADFAFRPANPQAAIVPNQRRQVVDIAKCKGCHDGRQHGDTVVPMLSLHGGNRNQNLSLCVMCHNANQTDVPYRYLAVDPVISGPETAVDFKTMVHSIHSGGFRETPFVVIGRNSSINDYSDVRFPSTLRNCLNCHVEVGGKGSYELPLKAGVLGTTTATGSLYKVSPGAWRSIDVNPANDVKTSPTAAACSSCHDKAEARSHMMRRGGASFSTTQSAIGVTVRERCASCHGPGKDKDVKKVHEVGRSGSSDEHDD
jgi:OmcA/MtrC family decaheme c-type cytochrome